jgi:phage baseplate assembly protein W
MVENHQHIEESIENVLETTNGAKEMMTDTCTS